MCVRTGSIKLGVFLLIEGSYTSTASRIPTTRGLEAEMLDWTKRIDKNKVCAFFVGLFDEKKNQIKHSEYRVGVLL